MKIYLFSILLASVTFFSACKGEQGPPGQNGVNIVGTSYELEVDFNAQNNYEALFDFNPAIFESDVVLAYIQWNTTDNGDPIWRLVPQSVLLDSGTLQYQYDFTQFDFRLFLESNFNLNTLSNEWTQNQVFRIVVVPSDFGARMDYANYDAMAKLLGIDESKIVRKKMNSGVLKFPAD